MAVDIRRNSPTFLKWHGQILSAENLNSLMIPKGFAHGFQTLDENSELIYVHTQPFKKEYEACLNVLIQILESIGQERYPIVHIEIKVRNLSIQILQASLYEVPVL